jgi:heme A synthase
MKNTSGAARFARFAWLVTAYNLAVVVWGGYVRATGSGAGCGNHWPLCNGLIQSRTPAVATLIEFTHRLSSGLDLVLVAALAVWACRLFPKGAPARLGAMLSAAFLVLEALLGASLVLLEHVAGNTSGNRVWTQSTHLINTLTLLACLTLTAWWASGKPSVAVRGRGVWLAAASLVTVMLLAVTGAIAALGDTLFPSHTLAEGLVRDFSPTANVFLRLRMWHPLVAALGALWLGVHGVYCTLRRQDTRLAVGVMLLLVSLQMAAGMANLFLLAPVWMQLVHLLLADLLWISLVLLCAIMLAKPAKA